MKVLFFQPFGDGGIAHYAHNLMEALARQGVEVTLVTSADNEFANLQTPYRISPILFSLACRWQRRCPWLSREMPVSTSMRRILKLLEYGVGTRLFVSMAIQEQVDAVHVQTVQMTELLLVWLLKRRGIRVVFTIHNVLPLHRALRPYQRVLLTRLYALCDALVIHTESGKEEVVRLFGVPPEKVHVIPHGDYKFFVSDANAAKSEAKADLGIAREARTLLFFGAIRQNKGLETLLRATALLAADPSIVLMIVGEPCEDYRRYRLLIQQLGLGQRVYERLCYVPNEEVGKYFRAADLVVLPYHEVTQSGVLQVALAFGKPVIATAVGGLAEIIEEGVTGWLVPPGDAPALAHRIAEVLRKPATAEEVGARARRHADRSFSWDDIARRTMPLYAR